MPRSLRWAAWFGCGLGVAAVTARIAFLSKAFVWGDSAGWAKRPILEFVAWWLVAWLLYAGALRLGRGLPPRLRTLVAILAVAAAARSFYFGTNPVQEDDAYRYLWDGQQVLAGVNPYRWSPRQARTDNPDAPEDLRRLHALTLEPAAHENLRRVNNQTIPTVYPPLNMAVFAASQKVAPWSLDGLRGFFLAFELATILLVWFALRSAGANPLWTVVYAWCPLPIKEMANSPHHDALVVMTLALFLLLAVGERPRAAAVALALAVASKIYPVVLAPILIAWVWRRDRRAAVQSALLFLVTLAALYAPFLSRDSFRGTGVFASEWSSNAGLFSLVALAGRAVFGAGEVSFLGGLSPRGDVAARVFVAALLAAFVVWIVSRPRFPKPAVAPVGRTYELPFRCFLALAAGFALAPAQHPWYFAGILPFVALFPFRSWILLTGTLGLYYLRFHIRYHDPESSYETRFAVVRAVEYGAFYVLLTMEGVRGWLRCRREEA